MHESAAALDVGALDALLKSSLGEMSQLQHKQQHQAVLSPAGHGRHSTVLREAPRASTHGSHTRKRMLH